MGLDAKSTEQDEDYEALIQFLYMAPIGLAQISADGVILMANPVCSQLLMPLSRDGDLSNLFTALEGVAPDLRNRVNSFKPAQGMVCDALQIQLNAGQPGKAAPQILSLGLLKLDGARLMAVINDITREVQRERQLRQSEAWFSALYMGVTDYALITVQEHGRIDSWNPGALRVTGFSQAAAIGQPYSMLYPKDSMTRARLLDQLHEADQNGWSLDEGWRVRADGTRFWGSCLIAPLNGVRDGVDHNDFGVSEKMGNAYSLIIRDISEKREANEALRRAATTDHLTGLANRRIFYEAAELEIKCWHRSPRPLSLLLIDADHFKSVNDTYGHPAGDAVLRMLAASFTATFREVDVVARIGGEEFAVLLTGTSLQGAAMVAERFCHHVAAQSLEFEGKTISITVSAGVAAMDEGVTIIDALMKRADQALYGAKSAGRNRVERWSGEATVGVPAASAVPSAQTTTRSDKSL
jgi:diguanylate cyclase (GGDEF)-like protein/PAS domain S-box-containing protein